MKTYARWTLFLGRMVTRFDDIVLDRRWVGITLWTLEFLNRRTPVVEPFVNDLEFGLEVRREGSTCAR